MERGFGNSSGVRPSDIALWAHAESCRRLVCAVACELASHGVRLLAVKGVHLAFAVAPEPWYRPMADADAIVVGGSFARAVRLLRTMPAFRVGEGWSSVDVTSEHAESRGSVDLHRDALPPFFGRLTRLRLNSRACAAPASLCPQLRVPDPIDAACLAVAHFVKDSIGEIGHGRLATDLEILERYAKITPLALAERLAEHGLRRKGALAFTALREKDSRYDEWLYACSPSGVERRWAAHLVAALRRTAVRHRHLSFLLASTASDEPVLGALSVGWAVARGIRATSRLAVSRRLERAE